MKPWRVLERVLLCPQTREPLRPEGRNRIVSLSGVRYRMRDGVPILRPGAVDAIDSRHESNAVSEDLQRYMRSLPGPVLFLGAGSTSFRADNVIEVEYQLFRNTDVVADAHRLPMADGCAAGVVALNLFEHLADPPQVAREIWRVLQPGGEVLIHTAFLQPLHEAPAHYFNATEYGLRRWFAGFSDLTVTVSPNFNPYFMLGWCASELMRGARSDMNGEDRRVLEATTLGQLARLWESREANPLWDVFARLPDGLQRKLAAGFQLGARKEVR